MYFLYFLPLVLIVFFELFKVVYKKKMPRGKAKRSFAPPKKPITIVEEKE